MTESTMWLSQLQWFSSLGFVLLFLALEIGLAWSLVWFRWRALRAGPAWLGAYRFWVRVFALCFILSFSASVPVLLQFGSLWPALMDKAGSIIGPLLAGGILTVFLFKSCFLGLMLFGQRRLSGMLHWLTVLMVAVGSTVSALWFVAVLAWTRTPHGAELIDGSYQVIRWSDVILNPAMPWFAALFLSSAMLLAGYFMLGLVSAQSLRRPVDETQRVVFRSALWLSAASAGALVLAVGGYLAMVAEHQPALAAATAGYWKSGAPAELVLFGWPDAGTASNLFSVALRGGAGWMLARDPLGQPIGLDQFTGMMPPVAITFWAFRLSVIAGLLMLVVSWATLLRGRAYGHHPSELSRRWRLLLLVVSCGGVVMLLGGFAGVLFGGYPFAIAGTVTLTEVITPDISFDLLAGVTVFYWAMYLFLAGGFLKLLRHIARHGVVPVARRRGRA